MKSIIFSRSILIFIMILIFILFKSSSFNKKTIVDVVDESSNNIWSEILHVSNEQELIDKQILFETIKFMLKETEEDDPELIRFVRSKLIKSPEWHIKINLNNKTRKDFSQIGQSKYIDSLLNSKRNGFFVEAGGYNGEELSNSLYFELERNWTGILIEAIPSYYKQILSKNRKIFSINCCISNKRPSVAKFQLAGYLSNRINLINEDFQNRVDESNRNKNKTIIYVPCFSLNTILKAINVDKIDYFSLDVEGGELEVLKGIDFNKIDITTFSVEHNNYQDQKMGIKQLLESNNFKMTSDYEFDFFFMK
jgi:FkbM family methyltransferase